MIFSHSARKISSFILLWGLSLSLQSCLQVNEPETPSIPDGPLHGRPSWSPDGVNVAFTGWVEGVYGIHVVDTTRKVIRLIKEGEGIGVQWSPDAKWLVFSDAGSLYKIKLTRDSLTRMTTSASDIRPAWSPDGKQIAFMLDGIWLLNLETGLARRLTARGNYPSWFPGGNEIMAVDVVLPTQGGTQAFFEFIAIQPDNGSVRSLSSILTSADVAFSSIGPSSNDIVFSSKLGDQAPSIWKLTILPRTITQLTTDAADYPSWSPDGKAIVYTRLAPNKATLWIMQSDGTNHRQLTGQ